MGETPAPESDEERERRIEADLAALARVQLIVNRGGSVPPPRPSLPVRTAKRSYTLSRGALAAIGLLATLAEIFSDSRPLQAIVRWLFDAP